MGIKGYKVFNSDWTCRDFQYKVGETYIHNGNIKVCGSGFHFCQKASDCFSYYQFDSNNKVAEIEAIGLVETSGNKSVTDKIVIVREIPWQELLAIVNEGKDCTGLCNIGDCNTGDRNIGYRNTDNKNTGDRNTGNHNTGNYNTGNWNTGNYNTGHYNTGNENTGYCNTGHCNTGNENTGYENTGNENTGHKNTGDCNTGYCNTGYCNTGNENTGDWNSANFSTGFFNSVEQPFYIFNKPTKMSRDEIYKGCEGIKILNWNFKNSLWIYSEDMSDEEKSIHPEHEATGGYLKTVDFKTACKIMWNKLSDENKQSVKEIPNFNAEVFKEITGIQI